MFNQSSINSEDFSILGDNSLLALAPDSIASSSSLIVSPQTVGINMADSNPAVSPSNFRRLFNQGVLYVPALIVGGIPYLGFLLQSAVKAIAMIMLMYHFKIDSIYAYIFMFSFCLADYIANLTVASPGTQARNSALSNPPLLDTVINTLYLPFEYLLSPSKICSTNTLKTLAKSTLDITADFSFFILSSANGDLIGDYLDSLPQNYFIKILKVAFMGYAAILGTAYYRLITSSRLDGHFEAFIGTIKNPGNFISRAKKEPNLLLESLRLILMNSAYRAVSAQSIGLSLFLIFFGLSTKHPIALFTSVAGCITTFIITLFSRYLPASLLRIEYDDIRYHSIRCFVKSKNRYKYQIEADYNDIKTYVNASGIEYYKITTLSEKHFEILFKTAQNRTDMLRSLTTDNSLQAALQNFHSLNDHLYDPHKDIIHSTPNHSLWQMIFALMTVGLPFTEMTVEILMNFVLPEILHKKTIFNIPLSLFVAPTIGIVLGLASILSSYKAEITQGLYKHHCRLKEDAIPIDNEPYAIDVSRINPRHMYKSQDQYNRALVEQVYVPILLDKNKTDTIKLFCEGTNLLARFARLVAYADFLNNTLNAWGLNGKFSVWFYLSNTIYISVAALVKSDGRFYGEGMAKTWLASYLMYRTYLVNCELNNKEEMDFEISKILTNNKLDTNESNKQISDVEKKYSSGKIKKISIRLYAALIWTIYFGSNTDIALRSYENYRQILIKDHEKSRGLGDSDTKPNWRSASADLGECLRRSLFCCPRNSDVENNTSAQLERLSLIQRN